MKQQELNRKAAKHVGFSARVLNLNPEAFYCLDGIKRSPVKVWSTSQSCSTIAASHQGVKRPTRKILSNSIFCGSMTALKIITRRRIQYTYLHLQTN